MKDNLKEEFNKIVDMQNKRAEKILDIMTKMLSEDFSILDRKSDILSYTQMLLSSLTTSTFLCVFDSVGINDLQIKEIMKVYITTILDEIYGNSPEINNIKEMH